MNEQDLLLVVDVQNDFCPGGALAVNDGNAVVPIINRLGEKFKHVVMTQDWHPPGHSSFASSHEGKSPYDTVEASYGTQVLWPDHCVQGSAGAKFRWDLNLPNCRMILRKGMNPEIDSYSAFFENDRWTQTGLSGSLRELGIYRVFVCGLAYDFCVRYSAEDASKAGFNTYVIDDACRSVGLPNTIEEADISFAEHQVNLVHSDDVLKGDI